MKKKETGQDTASSAERHEMLCLMRQQNDMMQQQGDWPGITSDTTARSHTPMPKLPRALQNSDSGNIQIWFRHMNSEKQTRKWYNLKVLNMKGILISSFLSCLALSAFAAARVGESVKCKTQSVKRRV